MPVLITMRGLLEPVKLDEDFSTVVHNFNFTAAQGKKFVVSSDEGGRNILLNLDNVLVAAELESDMSLA